jgi:ribosomal protein S12 methylthiotransferase
VNNCKVHIVSLGCPKNRVDAEVMAAILASHGLQIIDTPRDAGVIIVNTCAFILPAKEEAIEEILNMARYRQSGALKHLIVTGCLSQRYGATLAKIIPEADLFLGMAEVPNIFDHIRKLASGRSPAGRSVIRKPAFLMDAGHPRLLPPGVSTAYLKIAEGCSNRCSYCVIPEVRGKARSRKPTDILREARRLADSGIREIILIAQDTTAYGRDLEKSGQGLPLLIRKLSNIGNLAWVRLLYTHPAHLMKDVLLAMAQAEKVCRYLDLPIQHIDDTILQSMNRRTDRKRIMMLIEKARAILPGVALRTSIITGFPGETEARFNRLLNFIREIRFDHLGVFTYSREEGTRASHFTSRVSEREKQRRRDLLMEEQSVISHQIGRSLIGSRQEVLVEGKSNRPDHAYYGRCRRQAPEIDGITYIRGKDLKVGDIRTCIIREADEYDLFADIVLK